MTFLELRLHVEQYLDQSQTGYFHPSEIDRALQNAQTEVVNELYADVEVIQKRRDALIKVTVKHTYTSSSILVLSEAVDYRHTLSVVGKWDFVCNGTTTRRQVGIKPIRHDVLGTIFSDPYNTPTNQFPVYINYTNGVNEPVIEVFSTTTPIEVELTYLKNPKKIDSENDPSGQCELPEQEQYKIIARASRILAGQTADQAGYQKQLSEISLQE